MWIFSVAWFPDTSQLQLHVKSLLIFRFEPPSETVGSPQQPCPKSNPAFVDHDWGLGRKVRFAKGGGDILDSASAEG